MVITVEQPKEAEVKAGILRIGQELFLEFQYRIRPFRESAGGQFQCDYWEKSVVNRKPKNLSNISANNPGPVGHHIHHQHWVLGTHIHITKQLLQNVLRSRDATLLNLIPMVVLCSACLVCCLY